MTQYNYSPGFETQVRKAMEMPEPDYQKMNLLREQFVRKGTAALKTKNQHTGTGRKSTFLARRPAWQLALVGVVILLAAALATPGTVKAIRSLLAFIPGIGYVEPAPSALVLAEPVVIEREGFILTVDQAVSTAEKTVIIYRYSEPEGSQSKLQQHALGPVDPIQFPILRLLDGSTIKLLDRQPLAYGDDTGLSTPLWFPALPAGTESATLEFTRLNGMPEGAAPQGWVIPIRFEPGDLSDISLPVIEYTLAPTADPAAVQEEPLAPPANEPDLPGEFVTNSGFTLAVVKAVELPDGYVITGSLQWSDPSVSPYALMLVNPVIKDANGKIISYEFAPLESIEQPDELRHYWSYKIPAKDFAAPLSLDFNVVRWDGESASFAFDPGPNPHEGQTWDLDIDVPVNEHKLKIISAKYINPYNTNGSFELTIVSDDIFGAILTDQNQSMMAGGGESNTLPQEAGIFYAAFEVAGDLSAGPLTVVVQSLEHLVTGDWTITWAP